MPFHFCPVINKKKRGDLSDYYIGGFRHARTKNKQYPPRHANISPLAQVDKG